MRSLNPAVPVVSGTCKIKNVPYIAKMHVKCLLLLEWIWMIHQAMIYVDDIN